MDKFEEALKDFILLMTVDEVLKTDTQDCRDLQIYINVMNENGIDTRKALRIGMELSKRLNLSEIAKAKGGE
ncbi:MAG: hypothetical protein ACI4JR_09545 [Acutalibacteraceae bacterium]